MAIEWDPILFVNLVLCIIIVLLGILSYRKSHDSLPLFIAAAFGLFGVSHAATLLGWKEPLTIPLIIIRALAYLLVIYALVIQLKTSMITRETQQAWVDFYKEESGLPSPGGKGEEEKK
jgi:hypothetical protein